MPISQCLIDLDSPRRNSCGLYSIYTIILLKFFTDESDEHGNFLKYKLVEVFNSKSSIPPPLYLLSCVCEILYWLFRMCCCKKKDHHASKTRLPISIDLNWYYFHIWVFLFIKVLISLSVILQIISYSKFNLSFWIRENSMKTPENSTGNKILN